MNKYFTMSSVSQTPVQGRGLYGTSTSHKLLVEFCEVNKAHLVDSDEFISSHEMQTIIGTIIMSVFTPAFMFFTAV